MQWKDILCIRYNRYDSIFLHKLLHVQFFLKGEFWSLIYDSPLRVRSLSTPHDTFEFFMLCGSVVVHRAQTLRAIFFL